MSRRVCGATVARDRLSIAHCWCRGLFCGPGGARRSREFWRTSSYLAPCASAAEFDDVLRQLDLFDDDAACEMWRRRLAAHAASR